MPKRADLEKLEALAAKAEKRAAQLRKRILLETARRAKKAERLARRMDDAEKWALGSLAEALAPGASLDWLAGACGMFDAKKGATFSARHVVERAVISDSFTRAQGRWRYQAGGIAKALLPEGDRKALLALAIREAMRRDAAAVEAAGAAWHKERAAESGKSRAAQSTADKGAQDGR